MKPIIWLLLCLHFHVSLANSGSSFVDMGRWQGRGALQSFSVLCIDEITTPYHLTLHGTGEAGAFRLDNGKAGLPFSVAIREGANSIRVEPLLPYLFNTEPNNALCTTGMPITFTIRISSKHLAQQPAGIYSGNLTVTVIAE